MATLRRTALKIRRTEGRGLGVVATTAIPARTTVIGFYGRPRWIWDIPRWCWDHCFQVDYDKYFVPKVGSFGWYINHSCNPNCSVHGERELVASRRIRKGEELTFDYSTNVGWDGYAMECLCGARNCRGVILSYAHLGEELKRKYGSNVSPYLMRLPKAIRPTAL